SCSYDCGAASQRSCVRGAAGAGPDRRRLESWRADPIPHPVILRVRSSGAYPLMRVPGHAGEAKMEQQEMSEAASAQTMGFQAEVKQLLKLMIHSLYSHKETFLRELVSNASGALDKLRFEALSQPQLLEGGGELGITLDCDPQAHTLTITDNGIGMTREEAIAHLGTIARS